MLLYTNYRRQNGLGQSRSVQRKRFAAVEASRTGFFVGWRLTTTLLIDPERRPARWRTCAARQPLPLGCLIPTYLEFLAEQSLHAS